jgi:hypothetical protein
MREAVNRNLCINNLKQIGLALPNYHNANGKFPTAAITILPRKKGIMKRMAKIENLNSALSFFDGFS